jgi:archaellum component FlaC
VRFLGELTAKHGDLNQALSRDMAAIVAEFSLDKEDSALSRLVSRVESAQKSLTAELSLDNENSALQRLHRMFQDHQNTMLRQHMELASRLDAAIQSMNTRRDEAAKSTRHGLEFEETLGDHLREIMRTGGDVFQETGSTTGLKPNCKVGDYVITIGPEKVAAGARIVIEAKESASYDLMKSLEEAEVARNNRQAEICVFVHSTRTAPASIPTFQRFGRDLVVRWNPDDDANDVWLEAALMVATALSVKAASHDKEDAASFEKIDKAVERVRKALEGFEEVNQSANTIKNSAEKILNRARIMQDTLATQVQAVVDEIVKLKVSAAKE